MQRISTGVRFEFARSAGKRIGLDVHTAVQTARPSLIYELPSVTKPLALADLFPVNQSLEVELGSGDASFLAEWAQRNPNRNFIGIERLLGRMRKLDRKGHRAGLTNLRGVRIESSYFLQYLLPAHSAAALHVYFPDPWPKQKHRKYRLVNEQFPALARRALEPRGAIHFRTDDEDYSAQILRVFDADPGFRRTETPPELLAVLTDFEKGFRARGITTQSASFRIV